MQNLRRTALEPYLRIAVSMRCWACGDSIRIGLMDQIKTIRLEAGRCLRCGATTNCLELGIIHPEPFRPNDIPARVHAQAPSRSKSRSHKRAKAKVRKKAKPK